MDGLERSRNSGRKNERIRKRLVNALVDKIAETCKNDQPEALAVEMAELDRILVEANAICNELSGMGGEESREFLVRITPGHVKVVDSRRGALSAPHNHPFYL